MGLTDVNIKAELFQSTACSLSRKLQSVFFKHVSPEHLWTTSFVEDLEKLTKEQWRMPIKEMLQKRVSCGRAEGGLS
jgi:hypothetical protein